MNKFIGIGRLVKDPDVRYSQGDSPMAIARYRLAINRITQRENEQSADFIPCICFGKNAEFAEKYLRKGVKISIIAHVQTGSYTNKEGQNVFTLDFVIENQEFVENKSTNEAFINNSDKSNFDANITVNEPLPFT